MFGNYRSWFITDKCQRAITYDEQMNGDYAKEHTKPIFNNKNLFTVRNLYNYHTLTELYKVLKFRTPYSIFSRFTISSRRFTLILHKVKLDKRKNNFFYNSAQKWNQVNRLLIKPYIIRIIHDGRDTLNYDLTLSVSIFKTKLREIIHNIQNQGDEFEWSAANFDLTAYHVNI